MPRRLFALLTALSIFAVSTNALAWWPWAISGTTAALRYLASPITNSVVWLGKVASGNLSMAKSLEWSIAANGAVLSMIALSLPNATSTGNQLEAKIVIPLKKDDQRVNPDPARFNDAASGSIDPAPKSSFSTVAGAIAYTGSGTYPAVIAYMGGEGAKDFVEYRNSVPTGNIDKWYVQKVSSCVGLSSSTAPPGYYMGWCGTATVNGVGSLYVAYRQLVPGDCPAGYTKGGTTCTLTDATSVRKPANTVPCEMIRKSDGTYDVDHMNPSCDEVAASVSQPAQNQLRVVGGSQTVTATSNSDNSWNIEISDSPNNRWRRITTGPWDDSLPGAPIRSVEEGTGTIPGGQNSTGGGGSSGTSSGSGGSCGGMGQPACALDDTGFSGKATDGDGLATKITTHDQTITDKLSAVTGSDKHGMDWTWAPSIPRVACTPLEYGTGTHIVSIDLCSTFSVIREALGWLMYIFMAWGLFDLLLSGTTSKGRQ